MKNTETTEDSITKRDLAIIEQLDKHGVNKDDPEELKSRCTTLKYKASGRDIQVFCIDSQPLLKFSFDFSKNNIYLDIEEITKM
jgi:hypothetical protein